VSKVVATFGLLWLREGWEPHRDVPCSCLRPLLLVASWCDCIASRLSHTSPSSRWDRPSALHSVSRVASTSAREAYTRSLLPTTRLRPVDVAEELKSEHPCSRCSGSSDCSYLRVDVCEGETSAAMQRRDEYDFVVRLKLVLLFALELPVCIVDENEYARSSASSLAHGSDTSLHSRGLDSH